MSATKQGRDDIAAFQSRGRDVERANAFGSVNFVTADAHKVCLDRIGGKAALQVSLHRICVCYNIGILRLWYRFVNNEQKIFISDAWRDYLTIMREEGFVCCHQSNDGLKDKTVWTLKMN